MICKSCGKDFVPSVPHQIWCSRKCHRHAQHARHYKGEVRERHILYNRRVRAEVKLQEIERRRLQREKLKELFGDK